VQVVPLCLTDINSVATTDWNCQQHLIFGSWFVKLALLSVKLVHLYRNMSERRL